MEEFLPSTTPYHKLKNSKPKNKRWLKKWWFSCLQSPADENDNKQITPEEAASRLEAAIKKTDLKVKNLNFRMDMLEKEAKELCTTDKLMAREKLLLRHETRQQHAVLVKFYGNLCRIKNKLEDTATIANVADTMNVASTMLDSALSELNIETIDKMMVDLEYHSDAIGDINNSLAQGSANDDFDVDKELAALMGNEKEEIEIPTVVPKEKEEEKEKKKKLAKLA